MLNETILPEGFDLGETLFPIEAEPNTEPAEAEEADPIEAQNEEAAAKAPVRGVSGSGMTCPDEKSLFEQGFDAASCW